MSSLIKTEHADSQYLPNQFIHLYGRNQPSQRSLFQARPIISSLKSEFEGGSDRNDQAMPVYIYYKSAATFKSKDLKPETDPTT